MTDGRSATTPDRTRVCVETTLRRIVGDVVRVPGQILGNVRQAVDLATAPLGIITGLAGLLTTGLRTSPSSPRTAAPSSVADTPARPTTGATKPSRRRRPPSAGLPLEDYESLAASQVVHRLERLPRDDLDRIEAFEKAHRGRRTVLGKIEQLRHRR